MRENKLWSRIEIAARFLFYGHAGCRIMSCERCGSTNILPVADSAVNEDIGPELKKKDVQYIWREIDICQNCGATVIERQHWIW